MTMNSQLKKSTIYHEDDLVFLRLWEASYPESYLKVYLKDNSASESPRTTLRPRITRGDQFTGTTPKPETRTSQSPLLAVNTSVADKADPVFADRQSGVIFTSGLIRASGDSVTVREFCKARGLAPTLHLVIPDSASAAAAAAAAAPTSGATNVEQQASTSSNERMIVCPPLPSFSLTLASPTTTTIPSPIHYPASIQRTFTYLSYSKEVSRAPRHMRIPHLPQYCAHTLRPFVPLTKCALCEIQILACEIWWSSRHHDSGSDSMATATAAGLKRLLRVPQVLPADCTPTTRSIYYALGLPLGELDESCIDWNIVDAIMFIPSRPPRRLLGRQLPASAFRESSSSRSRVRVLFRRARRFFSTL